MAEAHSSKLRLDQVVSALTSTKFTSGSTHNFYLYPARFSPEIARTVIETFSQPGDYVLDPFMGGGTAIIEGLMLGRSMIGIDINALAHFVANTRTRPLSPCDEERIREWAHGTAHCFSDFRPEPLPQVKNLPPTVKLLMGRALKMAERLPFSRQRAFARCVLLRLGQWALDCRDHEAPSQRNLAEKLPMLTDQMLSGLQEFVTRCHEAGLRSNRIVSQRLLLCRNAVGLDQEPKLRDLAARPSLVFTSPPYPRVHVLYHRWQVRGRKETPAPYWIAQIPDGHYASHYTGGSRTPTGERNYFSLVRAVFSSVRQVITHDGLVVQLIGFADIDNQLPKYLNAMADAGFEAWRPAGSQVDRFWRRVPNRKWYAKLKGTVDASSEVLLFHRPRC